LFMVRQVVLARHGPPPADLWTLKAVFRDPCKSFQRAQVGSLWPVSLQSHLYAGALETQTDPDRGLLSE
jgi:hypothetical protein